jgi:hypothetical protein
MTKIFITMAYLRGKYHSGLSRGRAKNVSVLFIAIQINSGSSTYIQNSPSKI